MSFPGAIHTCELLRPSMSSNSIGDEVLTYASYATDVPCRHYLERGKEMFEDSVTVKALARLMLPFGQQVDEKFQARSILTPDADTGFTGTLADASDTSMVTDSDASGTLNIGEVVLIESEHVRISAISGTTVTVSRGHNGTTAAAHTAAAIKRLLVPLVEIAYVNHDPGGQGHHVECDLRQARAF